MSSSDIFYKDGKEMRSSLLVTEVNLDDVEKGLLQLRLKPYDEDVLILRKFYDLKTWRVRHIQTLDCIYINCFHNDIDDTIEFNMHTSFDLFLFNICAVLGVGTLKTNDKYVDIDETSFAHIFQRVSVFYLTLEEFKLLDGFVGSFTFNGSSVSFNYLLMSLQCIHKSVSDGAQVPDLKSKCLKRGEKLNLWE